MGRKHSDMKYGHHKLLCVWLLALGLLILAACGSRSSDATMNALNNASASRGTSASTGCAAMTDEIAAITGLQLRRPLDLSAPQEGLLRGCSWAETGGGTGVIEIAKEPASKYAEMEKSNRAMAPERFKELKGLADKAYVVPSATTGWNAYALRGSESFRIEVIAGSGTPEQATKLLRLALDRL